jgi:formylmethanofuran dehydrogenase subunit D
MSAAETPNKPRLSLILVTYRDVFQYAARHKGEAESNYEQRSTVMRLSPEDMKTLGTKDGDQVKLHNDSGELIVRVKTDKNCWQGVGFIPASLYSNKLTSYDPARGRLPNFKRLEVIAEPAASERKDIR